MTTILEVVRAGAGSGKTTDLCNTVAQAVADGLDPARILATTFTKKAAAELKGRIQAKLLDETGHASADRLELAAIGTVHSVAHHLLRRYAIELGLSPRLEVFEHGSERVLSDLLATIPLARWEPLAEHADRLGVNDLPKQMLALLGAKRGNRINDATFREHMVESTQRVCELLAPDGPFSEALPARYLRDLAQQALTAIDAILTDTTKATNDAKKKLRSIAAAKGSIWGSCLDAARIKAGRSSGADQLLNALRLHGGEVRKNPQLHADLRAFSRLLAEETLALEAEYNTYKAQRGMVDFTDLETLMLTLLESESLTARLSQDYDLVLVDEFQDTNPLQLAIFQRLRSLAPRNRWVGDSRQAIYGFRDTDPRLVAGVWDNVPEEHRSTLPNNHRSQKGLVQLVGELFAPHFEEDPRQIPQKPAAARGVERWLFISKNNQSDAICLGCGLAQLHKEGIRFGDIAILERGNAQLKTLAGALDSLRIPYLIESPGLFFTREGQMLLAGLRLAADRKDSLAAATILHLSSDPETSTPQWLSDRLAAVAAGPTDPATGETIFTAPWEGQEMFAPLEAIDFRSLSPSLIVQQVIEALGLPKRVHGWGDAPRRCSNLDSAIRHARDYEETARTSSGSATLSGLILYFEQLSQNQEDLRYTSQGHDAITLMTYHGAKGLEWPVVVLSGLHSSRDPDMWKPVVRSAALEDDPLSNRQLRNWIWPFGMDDGPFPSNKTGSGLEIDALASAEGLEQSLRESEESMRLLYVGCTRAKQKLVFAHRRGNCQWLETLSSVSTLLDPSLSPGEHPINGIDTTLVIRHLDHEEAETHCLQLESEQVWFAGPDKTASLPNHQRFHSPSTAHFEGGGASLVYTFLPGEQFFPATADDSASANIGNAVHSYMAALPSLRNVSEQTLTQVAERCVTSFGVSGIIPASVIVYAGKRFCSWVETSYPGANWHTELPVSSPRLSGGQWIGTIDLVLELLSGELVIIDHKSAPIRRTACEKKAEDYIGQICAYREVLQANSETVTTSWIHFPLAGALVKVSA
jgi:ATP-dependent helicase/nuclease subunit A